MKVDILVAQMKTQKCDSVLEADPEFLSNVFFAMPNCYRREWLKSKVDHTWQNMITFLNEEYDRALEEQILLGTYSGDKNKKTEKSTADLNTLQVDDTEDSKIPTKFDGNDSKTNKAKELSKCPVCTRTHWFLNTKTGHKGTATSLENCPIFQRKDLKARAEVLRT